MPKSPESELLAKFFADMGEKCSEKMAIFVFQFPGKVGAKNFTKKWRQIRLAVNNFFFSRRDSGSLGAQIIENIGQRALDRPKPSAKEAEDNPRPPQKPPNACIKRSILQP